MLTVPPPVPSVDSTTATATAAAAAAAVNVSKIYGTGATEVRALDDISVSFANGQFSAIMGPSGSGKSTLMHCLAGLDTVSSGSILIGDTDLSTLDEKALTLLRRDRVGFIFQAFNLVPTLSAMENITLPMDLAGRTPDQAWLDQVIETVGLPLRPRSTSRRSTARAPPRSGRSTTSPCRSQTASSAPSWARRAQASRPSCTAWPVSTPSRAVRS